jgi:hypothetical protein
VHATKYVVIELFFQWDRARRVFGGFSAAKIAVLTGMSAIVLPRGMEHNAPATSRSQIS